MSAWSEGKPWVHTEEQQSTVSHPPAFPTALRCAAHPPRGKGKSLSCSTVPKACMVLSYKPASLSTSPPIIPSTQFCPRTTCAPCRAEPPGTRQPAAWTLPPPRPLPAAASASRVSPKVLTAIGEMAQQIATINNLLIFINIQISRLQKLKGGG